MKKVIFAILFLVIMANTFAFGEEKKIDLKKFEKLGIVPKNSSYIFNGELDQALILEKKNPKDEYTAFLISTPPMGQWKIKKEFKIPIKQMDGIIVNKDFTRAFILCDTGKVFASVDIAKGEFTPFYTRKKGVVNNFYPVPPFSAFFVTATEVVMFGSLYDEKGEEVGPRIVRVDITKKDWDAFTIIGNLDEATKEIRKKYPSAGFFGISYGESKQLCLLYKNGDKKCLFFYNAEKNKVDLIDEAGDILGFSIDKQGKQIAYIKANGKKCSLNLYVIDKKENKTIEEGLFCPPLVFSPSGDRFLVLRGKIESNKISFELCKGAAGKSYKPEKIYGPKSNNIFYQFKGNGKDVFVIEGDDVTTIPSK